MKSTHKKHTYRRCKRITKNIAKTKGCKKSKLIFTTFFYFLFTKKTYAANIFSFSPYAIFIKTL